MDFPGLRLPPLKGNLKGFGAVGLAGNVRVISRFEDEDPDDVDYGDYLFSPKTRLCSRSDSRVSVMQSA
jgi:hypothetical protein